MEQLKEKAKLFVNVEVKDNIWYDANLALNQAVLKGNEEAVKILIPYQKHLMAPDVKKAMVSALMLACKPKKQEIAKLLLCQAGLKDSYKYPAMMYALDNNALKVVEWLADNEEENIF